MRVKRNNIGVTMFLTDHEYSVLQKMFRPDTDEVWKGMTSGERRSWSQRIRHGNFLRIDLDKREEWL